MKTPLTFVCTSLKEYPECFDEKLMRNAREQEIKTLFKWVKKSVENWPVVEWGPLDLRSVCVILPSRLLVSGSYMTLC